jgi:hypothetical protein
MIALIVFGVVALLVDRNSDDEPDVEADRAKRAPAGLSGSPAR